MSRRLLLPAALLLALAACNKGSAGPAFRFDQPSSLAVFWGYSHKNLDLLHPYVAVANTAKDELVFFDPVDDGVVASPVLIRPLTVPVPDPRPAQVASTRFTGNAHSDLLVVVSQGATSLQLIRTWASTSTYAYEVDPGLASDKPVELESQVVTMLATPAVDATGGLVPDRAWVIASLVDGRLAVVEYQLVLTPVDGSSPVTYTESISAVTGAPTYQSPGFQALSLAVDQSALADPGAKKYLYAATVDDILPPSGVHGVAQLDLSGAVGAWSIAALDAHAPTRLVAAFTLRERNLDSSGAYDQLTDPDATSVNAFQATAVHRVYAWLDPGACGPSTALPCGLAVIDPAAGDLLEDPWHAGQVPKQYLRPIALPAQPAALVIGPPPVNPPTTDTAGFEQAPYMYLTVAGNRTTTGVLLAPSDNGQSYIVDLARWEVPSASYEMAFSSAQETQVSSFRPSNTDLPQIGFFRPDALAPVFTSTPYTTTATAASFIRLMPGFTPTDIWSVTFQGTLPAFAIKHVSTIEKLSGTAEATLYRVAVQATGPAQVVNVYDPAYGVRVGDTVEFWTSKTLPPGQVCPDTPDSTTDVPIVPIEGKIVSIDAPDAQHPGGSLQVAIGDCVPVLSGARTTCDAATHGPWTSLASTGTTPGCWGSLGGQAVPVTIRAQGGAAGAEEFVVVGTGTGYAGRAPRTSATDAFPSFEFTNDGEAALVAACPLIPWPSDPLVAPACDGACRLTCEQAAIARRARRDHLTSAICNTSDQSCYQFYFPDFNAPASGPPSGPVLAFSLGWQPSATLPLRPDLVRDTQVIFATHSGYSPASRYGGGVNGGPGTHPMGAAYFDRSQDPTWGKQLEGYRFYVPYVADFVLDVSPAHANSAVRILH